MSAHHFLVLLAASGAAFVLALVSAVAGFGGGVLLLPHHPSPALRRRTGPCHPGLPQWSNAYSYAGNDPIGLSDPTGLKPDPCNGDLGLSQKRKNDYLKRGRRRHLHGATSGRAGWENDIGDDISTRTGWDLYDYASFHGHMNRGSSR
ncbi:hypothetical protein Skr01_27280 [Sphaerisporangium krabiense]|uniref:Uncharacterized protein n=1 Tax=Sphaerisporangium krabiense TaxID=763782 RepID=A0A7W8ZB27_9ACTN|nr:hypothetical protein [Sphaerisporangium krabiense]MBB5630403.1 hypothetical protein [Sphaerisporangium krabiense]GII62643.1 hypothetical protein Skr01_27280 [Sphaerisporangium krabiense]